MIDMWLDMAKGRLKTASKPYILVEAQLVTQNVRKLTFASKEPMELSVSNFDPYGFV